MASDDPAHRRNHSTNSAIPLQNLNPYGTPERVGQLSREDTHRRTLSDRGRILFRSGRADNTNTRNAAYTSIESGSSPSPIGRRAPASPVAFVTTPSGQHERIADQDDEVPFSPVSDRGAFQSAIGFAGLSYNVEPNSSDSDDADDYGRVPSRPLPRSRATRDSLPPLQTNTSTSELESIELEDRPSFLSPADGDDDTLPLTDGSSLRPVNGTANSGPAGQRHDRRKRPSRLSGLSVRFSPGHGKSRSPSDSRLGDDLPNLEAGSHESSPDFGRNSSSRKLSVSRPASAASPLSRTGTILQQMSQRVVNLSNESEVVERSMRHRTSATHSRAIEGPRTPTSEYGQAVMDGPTAPRSPASEKIPVTEVEPEKLDQAPVIERNPLRGKSLGIFGPESKLRQRLLNFLVHPFVEPFILVLIVIQTVILAVDAAPSVYTDPRPEYWGNQWTDWSILAIFIIYTIEIVIKIIVSGFMFNAIEYSTIDRSLGVQQALYKKANSMFSINRRPSQRGLRGDRLEPEEPSSILRSFTIPNSEDVPGSSKQAQKKRLAYRAFLRHSFNRLDFVAVVSFWISLVLCFTGIESKYRLYVFQMMSSLRVLRLLGITSGTSVILRSLKRAVPTLLNIAFLIGFFWLLFAIVGVQSFKSSLRRQCVWDGANANPPGSQANYTQNTPPPGGSFQFCGGWVAANGSEMPWVTADGGWGANKHKGFLCPVGSYCVQGENPYNGTVSFDNILQSAEMVFVVMTSNTFTDTMYYLTDSDYLASALFAACGIVILAFWLISLLIAVITSSFQIIREESNSSAFIAQEDPAESDKVDDEKNGTNGSKQRVRGLKRVYMKTNWIWIIVIIFSLAIQAFRTDTMGSFTRDVIVTSELVVTLVLLFEIIFRFVSDWRDFPFHVSNWFDLFLAIVTTVIQIPVIRNSGTPYAWLTIFQILRIYRVVLAVPLTRDLIMLVLRPVSGVLNLIVFVFLLTFLGAIFANQLFRGQLPMIDSEGNYIQVTFATIFNSFLGMYQIFSSENWTTVVYNVTRFEDQYGMAWIAATFFIIWFILANFIVLNMFIAVIQENFDVSEDQKRMQQVRMFLQQKELGSSSSGTLSLSTIFKFGRLRRQDPLDFGSAATEMLLKDAVVRDFLDDQMESAGDTRRHTGTGLTSNASTLNLGQSNNDFFTRMKNAVTKRFFSQEPNPFYSRLQLTKPYEELDARSLAREVVNAAEQRKVTQREYLRQHPKFNVSLYIFQPDNPIRKFCQRIVGPGRGERMQGVQPNPTIWYSFSAFIYLAIVAMVLLACVTTPLFQYQYLTSHPNTSKSFNWFSLTDLGFAALFTIEAVIKIVADGFWWTPNAFLRSSWGFIDGIVLITLWVNVLTSLYDPEGGSRVVGAFKALRALRLLNVSDSARDTFHSVIIQGGWKVLSAAFVSLSLLIPFAIYGLNLFAGKMVWCNDWQQYDLHNLTDCVGEYQASPFGWDILSPRRASNSYYSFDSFGDSLFILFQIVSQEGWVDVMWSAQSITGVFTQPAWFAQQGNAIFFVVFNLLGAVFVLTLFVSVFMRNYTEQTGVAFLTSDQRSWLELRKLLRQVAPSKRPNRQKQRYSWQEWCYRRAVTKNGQWQRTVTGVLLAHLILLCLEWYPEPEGWTIARNTIFLGFVLFYAVHIVIRIIGLSWTRFRRSAWDVYSLVAVLGAFATGILSFTDLSNSLYSQAYRLILVALALLLIPRNNQLDQLFKTAAASFSAIANLLATWFVLFLAFAIAFTQTFGLTRFGPNENNNLNFRNVPKALILLFRMSVGEGWNQIMNDYSRIVPPYCIVSKTYFEGDCGSLQWSYALFVSWNILSMYIFVNLFISLIYESFSYVYQRSTGLSIISREEIRRFKQAWAEFDPEGTGYISKEAFPRFLGELSGVFEMRIYDGDFSVRSIIEDCRAGPRRTSTLPVDEEPPTTELDLAKLNRRLADLPVEQVRTRRARMNTFYEEVLVSADPDRGIAFNDLLMILAHYKVISDNKSLRLEEFLRRRARLQRVEEAVHRNIVVGFFDTMYWSRRFRRAMDRRKDARMKAVPMFGVPEIFVHDEGGDAVEQDKDLNVPSVNVTPVDHTASSSSDAWGASRAPTSGTDADNNPFNRSDSESHMRRRSSSQQTSPVASPRAETFHLSPRHRPSHSGGSIQPDWRFAAAIENVNRISPPGSPGFPDSDFTARNRANSAVSQNEMVGMFQDSAWGQSMRRSFTQRRSNTSRRTTHNSSNRSSSPSDARRPSS